MLGTLCGEIGEFYKYIKKKKPSFGRTTSDRYLLIDGSTLRNYKTNKSRGGMHTGQERG